ncbi:hypothetical protein DN35_2278 [Vibrio cholerae]|nr:hypothetical protein DN35_2278 [Vibrio cholerae]
MTSFDSGVDKAMCEIRFSRQHGLNAGQSVGVKATFRAVKFLFVGRDKEFIVLAERAAVDGFFCNGFFDKSVIHSFILSSKKGVLLSAVGDARLVISFYICL